MKEELLKVFSELDEAELQMLFSLYVSFDKAATAADSIPNVTDNTIRVACGQVTADGKEEYQVQLAFVADKDFWIQKEIVDVAPPGVGGNLFIDDVNIN